MESIRLNKVSRMIQKELSTIFLQENKHLFNGNMVSVTVVRMSPDLMLAKIYVSIFNLESKAEVMILLNENKKVIRHKLGQRIRHQVKAIPELAFFEDDSLDYFDRIEKLLKK